MKEAIRLAERGQPVRLRVSLSGTRSVTLRLDPHVAPMNVANLVLLAREGYFNGRLVPRVVPDFVVQMGSPFDTMDGGPGYTVPAEIKRRHEKGSMAMARTGDQVNEVARQVVTALEQQGVRALNPAMGFPMEMDHFPGGKIWVVSHKPVAVAAGLGHMGIHRSVIHPRFGSFILLGTVLIGAEAARQRHAEDAAQQRIPGLGNGVLQDILWAAKIHPRRKVADLSADEIQQMFHAVGFVLRAAAGAVVLSVTFSDWLLILTILLALFLALSKRRHELVLLADGATSHRPILQERRQKAVPEDQPMCLHPLAHVIGPDLS